MAKIRSFYDNHVLLQPNEQGHTSSRWTSDDLSPVPKSKKRWEWYHVGGFWIAEGFSAAQVQTASAAVAVGLNPRLALLAYFISAYVFGVTLAATSQVLYGQIYWNPLEMIQVWDNRPAKSIAALLFAFAAITKNVAANSISFGNDLTTLFPKHINIRRDSTYALF
ncbi:MAG: hypothetical protein L6R38_004449 [Xanthoria sp. 2 TBL-2021]|nr:MAG: hypothetical protein L6R38_004449 [Xanthoria sp. 2 TBL-2021]